MTYKRKEIIGDCTLYLGDCLEVMPMLDKVDAVVTDPPYGIGFNYNTYKDIGGEEYINLLKSFNHFPSVILQYPEEMIKYVVPAHGMPDKIVTWCYNSPLPRQHRQWGFFRIKPDFDSLKFPPKNPEDRRIKNSLSSEGVRSYDWWADIQQVKNIGSEKTDHPCQVSSELVKRVIHLLPDAQKILDPFMGSGTTLVACAKMGRKGIGIELDEKYFDIACRRVEEAYKQADLFIPAVKHIQDKFI